MREGIRRDVEPRGLLEELYVGDIACIVSEMLCLRRYRAALMNAEWSGDATVAQGGRRVADLARRWFSDPDAREEARPTAERTEIGLPNVDAKLWYAFLAPRNTPPDRITRLYNVLAEAGEGLGSEKQLQNPASTSRCAIPTNLPP